ncbi:hypothetical protein [Micromonospora sp. NPDC004704]
MHRGETTIHRSAGRFEGAPVWSNDGQYVSAVTFEEDPAVPGKVIAAEVATGKTREFVCSCTSVAGHGGSTIAWGDAAGRLFTVDLAQSRKPRQLPSSLPDGFTPRAVVAGMEGLILVHALPMVEPDRPDAPADQHGSVYAISDNGPPVLASGLDPVLEARSVAVSGRRFAYGVVSGRGDCVHWGPVTVYDHDVGATIGIDSTAVLGTGPEGGEVAVDELWWAVDGSLHAALSVVTCDSEGGDVAVPASHWRLTEAVWVPGGDPVQRQWILPGDSRLVLDDGGRLRLTSEDSSREVARNVVEVSLPAGRRA